MAKSQKRSNREVRKPKSVKVKAVAPPSDAPVHPVNALMKRPKGKA